MDPPSPMVLHGLILFSLFSDLSFFVFPSPFPYDVAIRHFRLPIPFPGDSISVFPFQIVIPSPKLTPIMRTISICPVVAPNKKKISPSLPILYVSPSQRPPAPS